MTIVSKRLLFVFCCMFSYIGFIFYLPDNISPKYAQIIWSLFDNKIINETKATCPEPNYKYIWKEYFGEVPSYYNCADFVNGNAKSASHYHFKGRVSLFKEPELSMDCKDIRRRVMGRAEYAELKHPYAIARNVYENYSLQELLLAFSYSNSTFYCYAIDKKSQKKFKENLKQLAKCLPNVFILEKEYSFNSDGHYQDRAHYDCVIDLLRFTDWEYVMFLQNADVFTKTPEEISQIVSVLNGTSLTSFTEPFKARIPKFNWTAKALKLFKNESEFTKEQLTRPLTIRKSSNQMFLPRQFMSAIINKLNLTKMFELFHTTKYGGDEMLFATLISAHFLNFPGQIEAKCNLPDNSLRFVHWNFGSERNCLSFKKRHSICLIGVEYITLLNKKAHIIANKIWPQMDFGAIMCIGELLYNRTNDQHKLNLRPYQQISQVRENELKSQGKFNVSSFKC